MWLFGILSNMLLRLGFAFTWKELFNAALRASLVPTSSVRGSWFLIVGYGDSLASPLPTHFSFYEWSLAADGALYSFSSVPFSDLEVALRQLVLSLLLLSFLDEFLYQLSILLLRFLSDICLDHFVEDLHFGRFELLGVRIRSCNLLHPGIQIVEAPRLLVFGAIFARGVFPTMFIATVTLSMGNFVRKHG